VTDIARCLLLPDSRSPSDGTLKNLALYWDQIVVPDATYRVKPAFRADLASPPARSVDALKLEEAGIVVRVNEDVPAEAFMKRGRMARDEPGGIELLAIERDETGRTRFTGTLQLTEESLGPPNETKSVTDEDILEAAASLRAESLIARARLGREMAAKNHLAPIAPSLVSHLACLVNTDESCPVAEATMMGAAIESFVVAADTPVATIVAFREKNALTMQRFRGAMADLAATLRESDVRPEAALDAARDVYLTRVQPSLGALEERLNERRLKFAVRSILGAAALTIAPLAPIAAVESGIRLGAQTIEYRFSRQQLLDEHPYAYLHRLASADFMVPRSHFATDLISTTTDPEQWVYEYFDALFELANAPLILRGGEPAESE
jgi:hypothetical protein